MPSSPRRNTKVILPTSPTNNGNSSPLLILPDDGCPTTTDFRSVINAILYQAKTGYPWRIMTHDFHPEDTVRRYFHYFKRTRRFDPISNALRPQVCEQERHAAEPSLAMIDSQSVKAANTADERGYDGEKNHGCETSFFS